MKYILDEEIIPLLKERIMAQSDLKEHQIYPNIIELNIRDFTVNESIIINYCSDCEPKQSVEDMINSFKEMKKFAPLIVDKNNYLIDGYHRYLACLQLGIEIIPVIRLNVTLGK